MQSMVLFGVMRARVRTEYLLIVALAALVSGLMHGPINSVLPALYSSEFGIDLALIGTLLLAARLFDAISDPLIGLFSDKTQSKFGKRKPWIAPGAVMVAVFGYFLFTPGENANAAYFLAFFMLLYFAWTVQEIPFAAWILELSRDTKERARINGFRGAGILAGTILFTLAPTLIPDANGEMSFKVLNIVAIIMLVAVPLASFLLIAIVPQGEVIQDAPPPKFTELWSAVISNRPFLIFIAAYLFLGMHYGFFWSLAFIYMDSYLGIGDKYTQLFLPFFMIAPLAIPCWVWLMNRFGKYRVVAVAYTITLFILPLPWFISPGPQSFYPLLAYYVVSGFFYPLFMVPMMTILGDIIDLDEVNTGKNRSGQYLAVLTFMAKTTQALGVSLGLIIVGLAGFQPGAETQTEQGVLGLRIVFNFFPALTLLPAVLILWRFPITDQSQKDIERRLRNMRQPAPANLRAAEVN